MTAPVSWSTFGTVDEFTQAAGDSAVLIECNGMGGMNGAVGGRAVGTFPLLPGGVLHVHAGVDFTYVDTFAHGGASDVRFGGNGYANRIIVAGGAGLADENDFPVKGGDGGGLAGGDGEGPFGGAGGTQTSGGALGKGEANGTRSGGAGYWGGKSGGNNSGAGGGSSFLSPLLYDASTVAGGVSGSYLVRITPIANLAPNAPSLAAMPNVAYDLPNRFRHTFSDDQAWDRQSSAQMRYRVVGAADWTTMDATGSANEWVDVAAGVLVAGGYERQVRTADSLGVWGPWSASDFFTAVAAPADLAITSWVNGETIIAPTDDLTWSAATQDAYQAQVTGDDAGAVDTADVRYDTGTVVDAAARTVSLPFPDNGDTVHVRIRIRVSGVWSDWVEQIHPVSYTAPPAASFSLMPDNDLGRLLVAISNPPPGAGEPDTSYNEVWADDGAGLERKATGVPPNSTWEFWTPVSGRNYGLGALQVKAVGTNGSTTTTEEPV